jgi:hypothetical protein
LFHASGLQEKGLLLLLPLFANKILPNFLNFIL